MAAGDAAAPAVLLGQVADQAGVEMRGGGSAVDMHVDVGVVFPGQLEDPADLPGRVAVVARRGADDAGAVAQRRDHQRVGAGIVQQPFLRHHADLDVDGPSVGLDQRLDALEAAQPDQRVHLDMGAHGGGAVADAFLQGAAGAVGHVLDREGGFDGAGPLHRAVGEAAGLAGAAVDGAGLVEVDMGLDEAGGDQPAAALHHLGGLAGEVRRQRRDQPAGDADIGRRAIRQPRVAEDEVEAHPSFSAAVA